MRVYLYFIGKPREPHANAIAQEFIKRANRWADCQMREIDPRRFEWSRYAGALKVFLDPQGRQMDSAHFAQLIERSESTARDILFLVGGHDGIPASWKSQADVLLSLSAMTFPHELARAMLAEQIYRALASLRGHPYPR
ncbi:MAG: 23S rRNA (pseudouridine(1915)-N(3))-methyltransferase RlmH [Bryobacteraceae bacterium]|nr:23S rRNA (pseudouridine(1915)-N(3))-methyltransferase RlmH [Bryobacteraceae bacterium]MDW8379813.1 23S rRNA (pseudouridine(1915)-N(3))-methyltransferase RlmH [Bryobacterales bacterium]